MTGPPLAFNVTSTDSYARALSGGPHVCFSFVLLWLGADWPVLQGQLGPPGNLLAALAVGGGQLLSDQPPTFKGVLCGKRTGRDCAQCALLPATHTLTSQNLWSLMGSEQVHAACCSHCCDNDS